MALHRLIIDADDRLDRALARLMPELSRATVQRLIATGRVRIADREVAEKDRPVTRGEEVFVEYEPPRISACNVSVPVIFEDEQIIVLNKPAGLIVHPTPWHDRESVAGFLLARVPGISMVGDSFRPGIVHRLDADTSGLLVAAKTQDAYDYLKELFKTRQVVKIYRALIHGKLYPEHGTIDTPIGRVAGRGRLQTGLGRDASTEYWIEQYLTDGVDTYTLLRVQLHTGRTHQIRVHFSSVGHPIAGDRVYGGEWKVRDQKRFSRQFLHAASISFRLPSGENREFTCDFPEDLKNSLAALKPLI